MAELLRADDLIALLGERVAEDDARAAVRGAVRTLGLRRRRFSADDVMAILDELAAGEDTVAIAARFAKARVLLGTDPGKR